MLHQIFPSDEMQRLFTTIQNWQTCYNLNKFCYHTIRLRKAIKNINLLVFNSTVCINTPRHCTSNLILNSVMKSLSYPIKLKEVNLSSCWTFWHSCLLKYAISNFNPRTTAHLMLVNKRKKVSYMVYNVLLLCHFFWLLSNETVVLTAGKLAFSVHQPRRQSHQQ